MARGLTSAYAAGFRARTKVYRGRVILKPLTFDPEFGGLIEETAVRSFEISDPYLQEGSEVAKLEIAEDSQTSPVILGNCQF